MYGQSDPVRFRGNECCFSASTSNYPVSDHEKSIDEASEVAVHRRFLS